MRERDKDTTRPPKSTGFSVAGGVSMFILSVLLGVSGPFGTFVHGDFGELLLYWAVLVVASWFLSEGLMTMAQRLFGSRLMIRETVTIVVFTLVFTPFLIGWTMLVLPTHADNLFEWAKLGIYVLVICMVISTIRHGIPYWVHSFYGPQTPPSPEVEVQPARLMRRLPKDFSGDIVRISADGHRVEVVTQTARHELRMRLKDAVDEIWPVPGMCVHRSHWIAEAAVADVTESKGRPVLILTNGDEIPVGAKYQPAVEAAGWLSGRGMGTVHA